MIQSFSITRLFNETVHWRPKLDGLEFPLLDLANADWLERTVSRRGNSLGFAWY
jgi:hypothetical protein